MTLVDTSVWVKHLREHHAGLAFLLECGEVITHPFVIGELSCGTLKNRKQLLGYLHTLQLAKQASATEAAHLLEERKLWGRGIGWIDVHLLAAALLTRCGFWTRDDRLEKAALELGLRRPAQQIMQGGLIGR